MVIKEILNKLSGYTEGINLRKFKVVSKQCLNDPSNSHNILKKEFFKEMRDMAIRQIKKDYKNFNKMTAEEKEELIAQREKDLWQKVKSGGTTAFALIFGISMGN